MIQTSNVAGASAGNLPGLLVQDNISQPYFIFLQADGVPTARITQTFDQWYIQFTDADNVTVVPDGDNREYVPIGNSMVMEDGILYITSQDGNYIYPSVTGRPLDFVINVSNELTPDPFRQVGGGDATTTSYSVGVGGITCLRPLSSGGIFVSASNANFAVVANRSPGAPTRFGEPTFIRKFLFNATCLSDRVIFDTVGDTRFIDLTGVRSFNAVEQTQNEGRNTVFTSRVAAAFKGITQSSIATAGILYDNYELYAVNTIFGAAIAKYDTVNNCWSSFDTGQTDGQLIKILAKIELTVQRLYAVTTDDRLFELYVGPLPATGSVRTAAITATIQMGYQMVKTNDPQYEIQPRTCRAIVAGITRDCSVSYTPYVNNRLTPTGTEVKQITYSAAPVVSNDPLKLPDVNTQLQNILFSTPNCSQGWKMFAVFSWTGGAITSYSVGCNTLTPMNPTNSQGSTL